MFVPQQHQNRTHLHQRGDTDVWRVKLPQFPLDPLLFSNHITYITYTWYFSSLPRIIILTWTTMSKDKKNAFILGLRSHLHYAGLVAAF